MLGINVQIRENKENKISTVITFKKIKKCQSFSVEVRPYEQTKSLQ